MADDLLSIASLPEAPEDSTYYNNGEFNPDAFRLGQLLFFDKVLSGNKNIACATCHHPAFGTGDGLSLSVGEGGSGLGTSRHPGDFPNMINHRIGRNAQPLFNLGAKEYTRMFHDGRVEIDPTNQQFLSPAGAELPAGLDNVLAVQAMFPVVSQDEMAGEDSENQIAIAVADGNLTLAWNLLAARLASIPSYAQAFIKTYRDINHPDDIRFTHAANAMATFQAVAWRSDQSPFDQYLRGETGALSDQQTQGMNLFYGKAGCSNCHKGSFQTDHEFYATGMPQIGPGKDNDFDGHDDYGREVISGLIEDRYRFRTPSLRNVTVTGPWGHTGAFDSLREMVTHHLNPRSTEFIASRPIHPQRPDLDATDFLVHDDVQRRNRMLARVDILPVLLTQNEIESLLSFLSALTDDGSVEQFDLIPDSVPSGLPIDRSHLLSQHFSEQR